MREEQKKNHYGLTVLSVLAALRAGFKKTDSNSMSGWNFWLASAGSLCSGSNNLLHTSCFPLESDKVCLRGHFRDHLIALEMSLLGVS